jgi:spore germination protein KC
MRFRLALAGLLIIILLLTGCNGAHETDEVAWASSIGIDKAADGDLLVSYRIAKPAMAGGSEAAAEAKKTSELITIKAATLAEARNLLNTSLSRTVSLNHVNAIVIGEDLARAGIASLLGPLTRFREFRGTTYLVVARGTAQQTMKENKPQLESLISRWVENFMHSYSESSYYLPCNLHEFYIRLKSNSGAPLAAGYVSNPLSGEDRSSGKAPGGRDKAYLPGDEPRQGGNPSEFIGTAVFKEDKLAGYLDTAETRALGMLLNKFPHGYISVDDPVDPHFAVSTIIRNGRNTKISVDTSGQAPVIAVDVFLEGEITAIPSGIDYEEKEYIPLLENQISVAVQAQIMSMLLRTQGWGADAVDFGYYIRPKFSTDEELTAYNWDKRFRQAAFNVQVKTELRRTGLMRKSAPIRRE